MSTLPNLSAKDFQEPLLRVLGDLTNCTAEQAVRGEDTYAPVMALLGIPDLNAYGIETSSGLPQVQRWVTFACKNLRKTGQVALEGRGLWMLTPQGVQELSDMNTVTTPAPATSTIPLVAAPVVALMQRSKHLDDPYILRLVLNQTPCLGHYTPHKGSECTGCPVTTECRNTQHAAFARAALKLAEADAQALAAGLLKAGNAVPVVTPKPGNAAPTTTAPATRKGTAVDKDNAIKIDAHEEAICSECGQKIPKGSQMIWADDITTGESRVFHVKCFEALS